MLQLEIYEDRFVKVGIVKVGLIMMSKTFDICDSVTLTVQMCKVGVQHMLNSSLNLRLKFR